MAAEYDEETVAPLLQHGPFSLTLLIDNVPIVSGTHPEHIGPVHSLRVDAPFSPQSRWELSYSAGSTRGASVEAKVFYGKDQVLFPQAGGTSGAFDNAIGGVATLRLSFIPAQSTRGKKDDPVHFFLTLFSSLDINIFPKMDSADSAQNPSGGPAPASLSAKSKPFVAAGITDKIKAQTGKKRGLLTESVSGNVQKSKSSFPNVAEGKKQPKVPVKKRSKTALEQSSDEDKELDPEFEAECILAEKGNFYKIKWSGFDPATNKPYTPTWEPKINASLGLIKHWEASLASTGSVGMVAVQRAAAMSTRGKELKGAFETFMDASGKGKQKTQKLKRIEEGEEPSSSAAFRTTRSPNEGSLLT